MKISRIVFTSLLGLLLARAGYAQVSDGHTQHAHPHDSSNTLPHGKSGLGNNTDRMITVRMGDNMRFTPSIIKVKTGETIRFQVKNTGKVPHEMVLGTEKELREHASMMVEMPNMQHTDPNMLSLSPGQTGTLVWTFSQPGKVHFACTLPGHLASGMMGTISRSPPPTNPSLSTCRVRYTSPKDPFPDAIFAVCHMASR